MPRGSDQFGDSRIGSAAKGCYDARRTISANSTLVVIVGRILQKTTAELARKVVSPVYSTIVRFIQASHNGE